jgi:hypothetical protein
MRGLFGSAAAWCVAGSLDGSKKIGRWRPFGVPMRKRVCAQARRISLPTVLGLTSIPLGTQSTALPLRTPSISRPPCRNGIPARLAKSS